MSSTGFSVLSALKMKMQWHQSRQTVLADNVANADTPGFQARDLATPTFADLMRTASSARYGQQRAGGYASAASTTAPEFKERSGTDWEITPDGNGVVLEEQMMKVAENQMDFQLATSLYSRSLGMLRTAIGRR